MVRTPCLAELGMNWNNCRDLGFSRCFPYGWLVRWMRHRVMSNAVLVTFDPNKQERVILPDTERSGWYFLNFGITFCLADTESCQKNGEWLLFHDSQFKLPRHAISFPHPLRQNIRCFDPRGSTMMLFCLLWRLQCI